MVKKIILVSVTIAIIAILYVIFVPRSTKSSVIEISTGKVRGIVDISRGGKEFESFLGIPYAKPPVGKLRFEPPLEPENWEGVRDSSSFGAMCTQVDNLYWKVVGEEDCLHINVYKPVDVGALGFLSTQDGVIRGNNGLKDQTFALKWVSDNIRNFGGNPDIVTIFGESAGASAVHFHMLSPLSKGLFHKAISSSGTAIKLWSMSTKPQQQALRLGHRLNCPVENSDVLLTCLRNHTGKEIIELQIETITPLLNPLHMYGPTIEIPATRKNKDVFLPDHPYILMSTGQFHPVPWITGINSEEGLLLTGRIALDEALSAQLDYNWQGVIPEYLVYPPEFTNITKRLFDFYLKKPPSSSAGKLNFRVNFSNLTDLMTDRLYLVATREAVEHHSKKAPVYVYHNKHHGEFSFTVFFGVGPDNVMIQFAWKLISGWLGRKLGIAKPVPGVCHGDDLFLFFKVPYMEIKHGSPDYEMSRSLINLWTQFAYDDTNMTFNGLPWKQVPPTGSEKLKYLTFGDSSNDHGIEEEEFTNRIEFWKSLNMPWII
ncbi:unnamed protein product [Allacma fusca]|uniref:Carboxylic ester hydrolase n=1 Tax=Allacma fusca TaxID=39272 RepID=A0A8J2PUF3_9HEXA|nr:unnamed protein product [Allacma fusca]